MDVQAKPNSAIEELQSQIVKLTEISKSLPELIKSLPEGKIRSFLLNQAHVLDANISFMKHAINNNVFQSVLEDPKNKIVKHLLN